MNSNTLLTLTTNEIVKHYPETASLFYHSNINFYNVEPTKLSDVATKNLLEELEKATEHKPSQTPNSLQTTDLVDFIYDNYHVTTRQYIQKITDILSKLLAIHREHSNELKQVVNIWTIFANEMEDHLKKEEQILFPLIKEYAKTKTNNLKEMIACPIAKMESEHENHEKNLLELKKISQTLTSSNQGIADFSICFYEIDQLVQLTLTHVHIENNILFERMR
ncbi:MAG: hemerythrin domain-containing protein [Oscillospiraceae bacterium]